MRLVAALAANDVGPGGAETLDGGLLTTASQRADIAESYGLDASVREASPAALGLTLMPAPELLNDRIRSRVDGTLLLYRPGPCARRDILVACAGEAFTRAGCQWTWEDAQALADELLDMAPISVAR